MTFSWQRLFYTNKKVLIVGGNKNAVCEDFLFGADTVVQINTHNLENNYPSHVVYHSASPDIGLPDNTKDLKVLVSAITTGTNKYLQDWCKEKNILFTEYVSGMFNGENPFGEQFQWLPDAVNNEFAPLTGLVALLDIIRFKPEIVAVTGMSLYIDNEGFVPRFRSGHCLKSNQAKFLEIIKENKNVIYCKHLHQALLAPIKPFCALSAYEEIQLRLAKCYKTRQN